MRKKVFLPLIFATIYLVLGVIFVLNSGAGHDWGTGAYVIISLPLGLIALALEYTSPNKGFVYLLRFLGLIQYLVLGYLLGARLELQSST